METIQLGHGFRLARSCVLGFLCLAASLAAVAQREPPAPAPKATAASTKCHTLLAEFQGKTEDYFAQKSDEELAGIQGSIDDCTRNAYSQLPRIDLAVAGVAAGIVARLVQARIDRSAYNGLLQQYNQLLAKTTPKPSDPHTVTLNISPLPNGLTRTLPIGANQDVCTAVGSMVLECKRNVPNIGLVLDAYLVAMIGTPRGAAAGSAYLIGCSRAFSSSCISLVPGDYPAQYVGTDGLLISGIIPEGKPNDSPVHAIFVIYDRVE